MKTKNKRSKVNTMITGPVRLISWIPRVWDCDINRNYPTIINTNDDNLIFCSNPYHNILIYGRISGSKYLQTWSWQQYRRAPVENLFRRQYAQRCLAVFSSFLSSCIFKSRQKALTVCEPINSITRRFFILGSFRRHLRPRTIKIYIICERKIIK